MINNKVKNYFLLPSGCTENLGVVPWLRSCAFLFEPLFLSLLLLFVFVTRVFETIFKLPIYSLKLIISSIKIMNYKLKYYLRKTLLTLNMHFVKSIFILSINLICFQALSNSYNHILSIGEIYELNLTNFSKYSVGNSEIIKHRLSQDRRQILIKGSKKGYCELIIWKKNNKRIKHQFYVLSKQKQIAFIRNGQLATMFGLNSDIKNGILIISGEIKNIRAYKFINSISQDGLNIQIKTTLSTKVVSKIIEQVYGVFFKRGISEISCSPKSSKVICLYQKGLHPGKDWMNEIAREWKIKFIATPDLKIKNLKVGIKIIQIEKSDGSEIGFGLDHLNVGLNDIFNFSQKSILKTNRINLKQYGIDISTIARPEIIMFPGKKATIKLREEVSFQKVVSKDLISQEWKFIGLKINLKLVQNGSRYIIEYKSQFGSPNEKGGSSGSYEESSIEVIPNEAIQFFSINYSSTGKYKSQFPALSNIPLLGRLFTSKNKINGHKKIVGILMVKE